MELQATVDRVGTAVYIVFMMTLGIVGNTVAIYIYVVKYGINSSFTTYTAYLAILDLAVCVLVMPADLVDLLYPYDLYSSGGCKVYRYTAAVLFFVSVFTLLVIAIDRYRRVCKPLKIQMNRTISIKLCAVGALLGFICGLPVFYINGTHQVKRGNVTLSTCFICDEARQSFVPTLYTMFLLIVFAGSVTTLSFLYFFINRALRNRSFRKNKVSPFQQTLPSESVVTSSRVPASTSGTDVSNSKDPAKQKSPDDKKSKDKSMLFFVITMIFVLSYLPYLILAFTVLGNDKFRSSMSEVSYLFYRIGLRLTYIQNVVNIVIYGLLDTKFKLYLVRCFSSK